MTDIAEEYKLFLLETAYPWCWACGRGAADRPRLWGSPWLVERAHIVSAPRVEDRRAVILLCSACHRRQHGELIALDGIQLPPISLPFMLRLKKRFDRSHYDRKWLDAHHVGRLPRMAPIDANSWYREQYFSRRV